MKPLNNKVALVTGASRSIGKAIALKLGSMGIKVIVNYKSRKEEAEQVVKMIKDMGSDAVAIQANVSVLPDIKRLFKKAVEYFGEIDFVVANAGISAEHVPIIEAREVEFDRAFNVNTKGVFFTLQEAAKMVNNGGAIIHISSSSTVYTNPNFAVYSGSKMAARIFVEVLSKELGSRDITVNSVVVGATDSGLLEGITDSERKYFASLAPSNRMGLPEDAANAVFLLIQNEARWINGQHIMANGGASV